MGKFHEWLGDELSLYCRQLAWLQAIPKADKTIDAKADPVSRIEQMKADEVTPDLPPNSAPNLVDYLFEVGPTVPAGMGATVIGWADITAWRRETGVYLEPWQARLLRRLSRDFLGEYQEAGKIDRAAPWSAPTVDDDRRAMVEAKVRAIFGGRARS